MTTQAYLQAPNKKGYAPIYVRYFHNTLFFTVPVKHSIPIELWDKEKRRPKPGYVEKLTIEMRIAEIESLMMRVARELQLQNIDPTRELVKARYFEEVEKRSIPLPQSNTIQPIINTANGHLNFDEFGQPQEYESESYDDTVTLTLNWDGRDIQYVKDELSKYSNIDHEAIYTKAIEKINKKTVDLINEWIHFNIKNRKPTIYKRHSWLKTLQQFSKDTSTDLSIPHMDNEFYKKYVTWLAYSKNFKDNTITSHIKSIRTFLAFADEEYGEYIKVKKNYKRIFQTFHDKKEVIYLTPEEVDLVYSYRGQSYTEKAIYDKVIDMCVFMCITSLRISDCNQTERFYIDNGILKGIMEKTEGRFRIPLDLDPRIVEILERNNFTMKLMSEQEYNRQIKNLLKEVFRKHKIHQKKIVVTYKRLGKKVDELKYKWELIASHSNRRSFATNLSNKGWGIEDIAYIMGSTSIDELRKYISDKDHDIKQKVKNMNLITEIKKKLYAEGHFQNF